MGLQTDINLNIANTFISQAEEAFTAGADTKARELAEQAEDLDPDMDGDGVINYSDFAPSINNYYIYAGGIFLVCLVMTLKKSLKIKDVFKLKREKERRRKDKMKQEILNMVDEVVEKG